MSCPHNHHQKTGYPKNGVFFCVKILRQCRFDRIPTKTKLHHFLGDPFYHLIKVRRSSGQRSPILFRQLLLLLSKKSHIVDCWCKDCRTNFLVWPNLTKANVGAPRALNAIMYIVQFLAKAIFKTIASHWHLTCSHFLIQEGRWMPILRDPKSLPQM